MATVGVIADDFTGTASAGTFLAKQGVRTGLFFDGKALGGYAGEDEFDAVFVNSSTRPSPPDVAYKSVAALTRLLKEQDVQFFSKKIDTTLRGGIGTEVAAMLDVLGDGFVAVMVTAMPPSRRICVGGYSIIDGTLLTETAVADDVRTPVRDSCVPRLVRQQFQRPVALVTIDAVSAGGSELRDELARVRADGAQLIVVDAIAMAHIAAIADACVTLEWDVLAVDPGPFTAELAKRRGLALADRGRAAPTPPEASVRGSVLYVSGSASPATKEQLDNLCAQAPDVVRLKLDPRKVIAGGAAKSQELERLVASIQNALSDGTQHRAIVVESVPDDVLDLEASDDAHGWEAGTSSSIICDALAHVTRHTLDGVAGDAVVGLVLTGGDTMESVCRGLGVGCIEAVDNIIAQVDFGLMKRPEGNIPVIVKGGFCGTPDISLGMVERLLSYSAQIK